MENGDFYQQTVQHSFLGMAQVGCKQLPDRVAVLCLLVTTLTGDNLQTAFVQQRRQPFDHEKQVAFHQPHRNRCDDGGKARNMHVSKRERRITGAGGKDKTAVMGLLERSGKVRTQVISSRKKKELHAEVKKHVEAGAALYTDALMSYRGPEKDFAHQVVDHAVQYVNGRIHTNGLENFWSLLKRGINGTYVSIEPFHLFRNLDEQSFRFNNRTMTDAQRFDIAARGMVGKRPHLCRSYRQNGTGSTLERIVSSAASGCHNSLAARRTREALDFQETTLSHALS